MQTHPFALLRQFPRLRVTLVAKEDQLQRGRGLAQFLGTDAIATVRQPHKNRTVVARGPMEETEDADGIVTDATGLTIAVYMADCQTFVTYAPRQNVVGVLHAGWKGLVAGAIPTHIKAFKKEWGIDPTELFVAAGPSLCMKCSEFTDPVRELAGLDPIFFRGRLADLRGAADAQLRSSGIQPAHMERHPDCTRCNPDRYWSYRGPDRELVKQGWENLMAVCLS